MILPVVFGTLLFVLLINIDELTAASYNSPTAPTNLHAEKNDKNDSRISRNVAPQSGDGNVAVPKALVIDKFPLLSIEDLEENTVSIGNETGEVKDDLDENTVSIGNETGEVKDDLEENTVSIGNESVEVKDDKSFLKLLGSFAKAVVTLSTKLFLLVFLRFLLKLIVHNLSKLFAIVVDVIHYVPLLNVINSLFTVHVDGEFLSKVLLQKLLEFSNFSSQYKNKL